MFALHQFSEQYSILNSDYIGIGIGIGIGNGIGIFHITILKTIQRKCMYIVKSMA